MPKAGIERPVRSGKARLQASTASCQDSFFNAVIESRTRQIPGFFLALQQNQKFGDIQLQPGAFQRVGA